MHGSRRAEEHSGQKCPPPGETIVRAVTAQDRHRRSIVLGMIGVFCAVAAIAAWVGYVHCAGRGMRMLGTLVQRATTEHIPAEEAQRVKDDAYRFATYADRFHLAQLVLGLLAVGLGWYAGSREPRSRSTRWLGHASVTIGIMALLCLV